MTDLSFRCRRSKIRCEESPGQSCQQCNKPGASARQCTYDDPVKPKGPKLGSSRIPKSSETKRPVGHHKDNCYQRESQLLTTELIRVCFEFYRDRIQSVIPLLDSTRLDQALVNYIEDDEAYVELCAFCACILLLPTFAFTDSTAFTQRQTTAGGELGDQLFVEARNVRRNLLLPDQATPATISTSLLLSECCQLRREYDSARVFTQEATNWSANKLDWPSQAQSNVDQRIYSTLFIQERLMGSNEDSCSSHR